MKLLYKTNNACIVSCKDYYFSNLSKEEAYEILKNEYNTTEERVYEQEQLDFMLKLADAIEQPYPECWTKYVELLSEGRIIGHSIENQKFPFEELEEFVIDQKDWKNKFAKELISDWMCHHSGF